MSKPSRKPVRLKPAHRSFDARIHDLIARVDLIPDYTNLYDADEERAIVAAFIKERVHDTLKEMQSYEADQDRDTKAITAALPDALRPVFFTLLNNRDTMLWIKGEVTYALGIEVGRRLAGGAR